MSKLKIYTILFTNEHYGYCNIHSVWINKNLAENKKDLLNTNNNIVHIEEHEITDPEEKTGTSPGEKKSCNLCKITFTHTANRIKCPMCDLSTNIEINGLLESQCFDCDVKDSEEELSGLKDEHYELETNYQNLKDKYEKLKIKQLLHCKGESMKFKKQRFSSKEHEDLKKRFSTWLKSEDLKQSNIHEPTSTKSIIIIWLLVFGLFAISMIILNFLKG